MEKETKNINTPVDMDLYWDFKRAASKRREPMPEAIENAIRLYLCVDTTNFKEVTSDDTNA